MELNFDPNSVKDEIDIFISVCEKEDPDGSYHRYGHQGNENNFTKCHRGTEFKSEPSRPIIVKEEAIWTTEKSQPPYSKRPDSDEGPVLKNESDECLYIVGDPVHDLYRESKIDVKNADIIDEQFIGLEQLLLQQNRNEEVPRVYYCNYCKFSSVYRGNLVRHIKYKHSSNFRGRHECKLCDYKCAYLSDLKRHRTKHGGKPLYNCYFCQYGINRKSHLHNHVLSKHSLNIPQGTFNKPKKCYACPFKTVDRPELLTHILVKHTNLYKKKNARYLPCGLCSYVTNCKRTLIMHIDAVHKKMKLYPCHLCSYATYSSSNLRVHISAKHYKITPYKCHNCKYASAYKKHLRRHIITQHINKKIRKNAKQKINNNRSEIDSI